MGRVAKREDPRKKFICRECKVQVVSRENKKAIYGKEHGKHCSRRFK